MFYLRPVPVMHKMISLFASDEFNVQYPCPVVRYLRFQGKLVVVLASCLSGSVPTSTH